MDFEQEVESVAALSEPVRRKLYRFVVAQPRAVSREQAADALGIAHHVAKFHLDRLESSGLLQAEFSRPPGRAGGPGAGRPAKLYRRSSRQITVSLPDRRYDLAGRVMAEAIELAKRERVPIERALRNAALKTGRGLTQSLEQLGFQPRQVEDGIELTNCPFHQLADDYPDLVCGMNLDLLTGLLEGAGLSPRLDPDFEPGGNRCCVRLVRVKPGAAAS